MRITITALINNVKIIALNQLTSAIFSKIQSSKQKKAHKST